MINRKVLNPFQPETPVLCRGSLERHRYRYERDEIDTILLYALVNSIVYMTASESAPWGCKSPYIVSSPPSVRAALSPYTLAVVPTDPEVYSHFDVPRQAVYGSSLKHLGK